MKYRIKDKKRAEIGDERFVRKFLLIPRKIGNEIRWLEQATIKQRMCTWLTADEMGSYEVYGWRNVQWLG